MTTKDQLYELINCLPESELGAAERLLNDLCEGGDPVLRALLAAPVVEPVPDEVEAFAAAKQRLAAGSPLVSHDDVRHEVLENAHRRSRRTRP